MQTATIPRTAPIALWRIAEAFLHVLHSLFGAPEDVAREHTLTRAAHTLMLSWLRVGEALLRRLLLIEAAAFANAPLPSRRHADNMPAARQCRLMSFTPENPEGWRVSFRCIVSPSSPARGGGGREAIGGGANAPLSDASALDRPLCHATRDRSPAHKGARRFLSAWPLAERYEALLRVFNAPHAYARRLAHRLHAQPQRLAAILHAPADYVHRVDQAEDITAAAKDTWPPPDSS